MAKIKADYIDELESVIETARVSEYHGRMNVVHFERAFDVLVDLATQLYSLDENYNLKVYNVFKKYIAFKKSRKSKIDAKLITT